MGQMRCKINFMIKKIDCGAKKYISELRLNSQTPGFCALIKKNDQIIYKKSVGKGIISSAWPAVSISLDSRFLCASLAKPVICKFFAHLKKSHPNLYHTSLGVFFPHCKNSRIKEINIQHLLSHRSGLSEYFGAPTAFIWKKN